MNKHKIAAKRLVKMIIYTLYLFFLPAQIFNYCIDNGITPSDLWVENSFEFVIMWQVANILIMLIAFVLYALLYFAQDGGDWHV